MIEHVLYIFVDVGELFLSPTLNFPTQKAARPILRRPYILRISFWFQSETKEYRATKMPTELEEVSPSFICLHLYLGREIS